MLTVLVIYFYTSELSNNLEFSTVEKKTLFTVKEKDEIKFHKYFLNDVKKGFNPFALLGVLVNVN